MHLEWGNAQVGYWHVFDAIVTGRQLEVLVPSVMGATDRYFIKVASGPNPSRQGGQAQRDAGLQRVFQFAAESSHATDDDTLATQFGLSVLPDKPLEFPSSASAASAKAGLPTEPTLPLARGPQDSVT